MNIERIKNAMLKKAAVVPNIGDASKAERTRPHFYNVNKVNGTLEIPRIAAPTSVEAQGIKNPPILEYLPKTKGYQLHQYPYMKPLYPTPSDAMHKEVDKLLDPSNKLLSPATKANYKAMSYKGDPGTLLQYAEYLKWRNATGGKTNP
jgi:hypothetical protein